MLSNKVKRNIWLVFSILSLACVVEWAVRLIDGSAEWWNLVSSIIVTALCVRFYLGYRRQVRSGILFNRDRASGK